MRLYPFILLFLLIALSTPSAEAQTYPAVWKKRVGRTIDLTKKEDSANRKLSDLGSDSLLVQMLSRAVKEGDLTAYLAIDADFSTKLTPQEWEYSFGSDIVDTLLTSDPTTGETVARVKTGESDWHDCQKVRILEDWSFDPTTGRTKIQIVGIGPVRDVYGIAGEYRGQLVGFWLKYIDAQKIIDRYDQSHPDNTISKNIWTNYFTNDEKPKAQK